ncbi:MAG: type II secretion system GspH family protein [Planctomycetes bacterium]|nr:type II secretion system GspH family protein [Planctomycetota bacterium]
MTSGASTTLRGPTSRRGLTLVEMVISMVLVSVMLVAALHTVGASQLGQRKVHSRREGHLLAQDLVSEILWQEYADPVEGLDSFGLSAAEAATANRSLFDDVDDYDGWSASPPQDKTGTEYPNLDGWQRSVAVAWTDPTDFSLDVGDNQGAKRITVTVMQDGVVVAELVALKTIGLPALEACCLGDGTCADLRAQGCVAQGGTPQGAGTTCASTTCPTESLLFVSGGSLVALPEGDPILIPTAQEELRIALIESWDFSVGLIAASAAQSDFDAAVAESDVAYVSGAVAAASLGTKLTAAPIGVVSENAGMIPLLGLASDSFEIGNEDQLEILDDAHHITADIASPVTFSNVRLTVTVLHGGTLAPDPSEPGRVVRSLLWRRPGPGGAGGRGNHLRRVALFWEAGAATVRQC